MSHPVRKTARAGTASGASRIVVAIAVLAPLVALMWVGSYAKAGPELFGFPFFYWYQLLWVVISAVLTFAAYVVVRRHDIDRGNERQAERDEGTRR